MVMNACALDDVHNLILSTLRSIPAFSDVTIYDGPPVGSDSPLKTVCVGDDGDPETDVESSFTQEWANLAKTRKRERGEIPCAVIAWDGSTAMEPKRAAVSVLLDAVGEAIRALASDALTLEITSGASRPVQNNKGAATQVPFTVSYTTTL